MRAITFLIVSLLISSLLSSCGSSNKIANCYSFSKGKNKKTLNVKLGFGNKKFKKKKKLNKLKNNYHNNSLVDGKNVLGNKNSLVLSQEEEAFFLKSKNKLVESSVQESLLPFSKDDFNYKPRKKLKKNHSDYVKNKKAHRILFSKKSRLESDLLSNAKVNNKKFAFVKGNDRMLLLYASLIGVLMAGMIRFNQSKLKRISHWAKNNTRKTIAVITAIKVSFILSGLFIGKSLAENDLAFSDSSRNILLGTYLLAALSYPAKKGFNQLFKHSYFRQKIYDFALVLSGFFIMICLGNKSAVDKNFSAPTTFAFQSYDNIFSDNDGKTIDRLTLLNTDNNQSFSKGDFISLSKKPEKSTGEKVILTILAGLLFLVLMALVASLACSLSCNGQDALAIVVGIGGGAGLIVGLIFVLKSINKKD